MQAPVARHSGISIHPLKSRQKFPNLNSDRKSTRLNSSHLVISYAVFCLKKKKKPHDESSSFAQVPNLTRGHLRAATKSWATRRASTPPARPRWTCLVRHARWLSLTPPLD